MGAGVNDDSVGCVASESYEVGGSYAEVAVYSSDGAAEGEEYVCAMVRSSECGNDASY